MGSKGYEETFRDVCIDLLVGYKNIKRKKKIKFPMGLNNKIENKLKILAIYVCSPLNTEKGVYDFSDVSDIFTGNQLDKYRAFFGINDKAFTEGGIIDARSSAIVEVIRKVTLEYYKTADDIDLQCSLNETIYLTKDERNLVEKYCGTGAADNETIEYILNTFYALSEKVFNTILMGREYLKNILEVLKAANQKKESGITSFNDIYVALKNLPKEKLAEIREFYATRNSSETIRPEIGKK